jgi:hypothetical protein
MEIKGDNILLGKPFVFTKENIDGIQFLTAPLPAVPPHRMHPPATPNHAARTFASPVEIGHRRVAGLAVRRAGHAPLRAGRVAVRHGRSSSISIRSFRPMLRRSSRRTRAGSFRPAFLFGLGAWRRILRAARRCASDAAARSASPYSLTRASPAFRSSRRRGGNCLSSLRGRARHRWRMGGRLGAASPRRGRARWRPWIACGAADRS